MALVKMIRDIPEVAGGKTEAMMQEEAVKAAIQNGWRVANDKAPDTSLAQKTPSLESKTETVPEPKAEVKAEKPEVKAETKSEPKSDKAESKKQKSLRDA